MAYDEFLADRIRHTLQENRTRFSEKKMFGGLAFMVNDKMCVGVIRDNLMARVGPEFYLKALEEPWTKPMDFTGRPLKGYVYVEPEGIDTDNQLSAWVDACLTFNPQAPKSKKRLRTRKS